MAFLGIDRDIENHWIYQDAEYFKVWFEILLRTRFAEDPGTALYEGQTVRVEYGEFIFGRKKWSNRLGISEQRLRTLMKKLVDENMLEMKTSTNKFSKYFVVNYEKYNKFNHLFNHQEVAAGMALEDVPTTTPTINQPPANHQLTTKEQSKQSNKVNNVKKESKKEYAEKVSLTDDEYLKLIEKYGSEEIVKAAIEKLSNYKCSKATKYKSDYHVLIGWVFDDFVKRRLIVLNGGGNSGHVVSDSGGIHQHSEPEPDWNKFVFRGRA